MRDSTDAAAIIHQLLLSAGHWHQKKSVMRGVSSNMQMQIVRKSTIRKLRSNSRLQGYQSYQNDIVSKYIPYIP